LFSASIFKGFVLGMSAWAIPKKGNKKIQIMEAASFIADV
jgi:hypothetical protein